VRAVLADVLGMPDDRIFRIAVEPASLAIVEWVEDLPTLALLGSQAYPSTRVDQPRSKP
jgi:hypothetical protein